MRNTIRLAIGAAMVLAGATAIGSSARADDGAGVKAGQLTCNVDSGWGFVFGSSRGLKCIYSSGKPGMFEHYAGRIHKFGVDIGYTQAGVIVWVVVAPSADVAPGALAGHYGGVTAGATAGAGLGANVLVGGSGNSIALQPLSLEGNQGLNIAAGIAEITLKAKP